MEKTGSGKHSASRTALESFSRSGVSRSIRYLISGALRHYPLKTGFETIALSRPLALFATGERHQIVRLRNGTSLLVFTNEHVGRVLMYMGDFDPRITYLLRTLLGPGDKVLDIGANVGWFTMNAAELVGRDGQVHSFEPQPRLAAALRASVVLNDFSQVKVHDYALSDRDTEMTLHVQDGNLGMASLSAPAHGSFTTQTVPVRNAANALGELQLGRLRLMKLDVEGHEAVVLNACKSLFDDTPPEIVMFESNGEGGPLVERDTLQFLFARNYRIFGFERSHRHVKLREQRPDQPSIPESNDYVAFVDGPSMQADLAKLTVVGG